MLAPAEPAGEVEANAIAEAPASDVAVDQAVATDDDEDVVEPDPEPEPKLTADDWTLDIPQREQNPDFSVRPPSPEHLVDYLPEASVLDVDDSELNAEFLTLVTSPDSEGAAATALLTFGSLVDLVNDGSAGFFAKTAAATCGYCAAKLITAYDVHDGEWELDGPWALNVDNKVDVQEVSGPDHLLLKIVGEDTLLVTTNDNQTTVSDFAGAKMFRVEMLFDQGQWWVIGVAFDKI